MDRKMLIGLLRGGMSYSAGKHRLWISRCFEITVRADKVVELDEYEGFSTEENLEKANAPAAGASDCKKMFHVGKSILHLKDGQVVESLGKGWKEKEEKSGLEKKA